MNHKDLEFKIRDLLIQNTDFDHCAEIILNVLFKENSDKQAVTAASSFFYYAQLYSKVIELTYHQISTHEFVSWDYFFETILKVYPLDKQFSIYKICIEYFKDPNNEVPELHSSVLDSHFSDVKVWKKYHQRKRNSYFENQKQDWLNQLKLFEHSENPSATEKKIIERIEKIFPGDKSLDKFKQKLNFKEYRKILNKYNSRPPQSSFDKESKQLLTHFLKELKSLSISENQEKDFMIFFIFLEAYPEALEWDEKVLKLECYMLAQQYSHALELIEEFNSLPQTIENSDWVWTLHYYRAQCLWGLNLKSRAIQALERIVSFNPDFRMSSQLLHEWKMSA